MRPNQAMQRTASRTAVYLLRVCHPPFGCVARALQGSRSLILCLVRWREVQKREMIWQEESFYLRACFLSP